MSIDVGALDMLAAEPTGLQPCQLLATCLWTCFRSCTNSCTITEWTG
jgi:hypothetical protein